MEKKLTCVITKTSASESVSESSDNSPEKPHSILSDKISLENAISHLTKTNYFTYIDSKGAKSNSIVFLTHSLDMLHILKEKNLVKKILIQDILNLSCGISSTNFTEILYSVVIKTKKKFAVIAHSIESERNYWFSCVFLLLKHAKDCFSITGLRKYVDVSIKNKKYQEEIDKIRISHCKTSIELENRKKQAKDCEELVIKNLLAQIIATIEEKDHEKNCKVLNEKIQNLTVENFLLRKSQGNLSKILNQKDDHIKKLSQSFFSMNSHLKSLSRNQVSPWKFILPFLAFSDMLTLKKVSKKLRRLVLYYLQSKLNWKITVVSTLHPRKIAWRLYMKNFYNTEICSMGYVRPEFIEDIKKDVFRGLPDHYEEVQEVLFGLCALIPDVGYCQGMHQVVHFLLSIFRDTNEVLGTLFNLLRPPFFLGELWKTGFSRLKLAIFQIKSLLKLKLPFMARHLKKIDMMIDVIVTPWILTVFTCFIDKGVSLNTIREIWDLFLVHGWPAIISTCLAFFSFFQDKVLGMSLENTMRAFSLGFNAKFFNKEIYRFEVSQGHLDELERAFYLKYDEFE